jgi:6-phosphofructokinase 1
MRRSRGGKRFSIVAVSEGAMSATLGEKLRKAEEALADVKDKSAKKKAKAKIKEIEAERAQSTHDLTDKLEALTRLESRVTILGHVQRGGIPSPADRLLASRLGSACAHLIHKEVFGVMLAVRGEGVEPVPLKDVVGKRKHVPLDHPWVETARNLGVSLGD